jgi:hypothetical protein
MINDFDLHCHTTASDGSLSPTELVLEAKNRNIKTLAITDHDTVSGVSEGISAGKKNSINIIPGIEVSIDFKPGTFHMCGYFIDVNNKKLDNLIQFVQESRKNRNPRIIEKINEAGFALDIDEVRELAGATQIGRPHIARALLHKGYVKTNDEAFDKYLGKGKPFYVDRPRISAEEALDTIKDAGGLAVVAHPVLLKLNDAKEYENFFLGLKTKGLTGIEAYSGHHSKNECRFFADLGKKTGLAITGGSDYHGVNNPNAHLGFFGHGLIKDDLAKQLQNNIFVTN